MRAMRVGTLYWCAATLHATRLISSLCVTAISMSASSMPALLSTDGCAALPSTVRRSSRSCSRRRRGPSTSTTVMSLASETRLSATLVPTCPAPRMMIFNVAPLRPVGGELCFAATRRKFDDGWGAFYAFLFAARRRSLFFFLAERDSEGFELAVKVGAFQTALLGHARDRTAFAREQLFEIGALERLARFAQRQLQRQRHLDVGGGMVLRRHALDVGRADFLLQRGEREVLHRGLQVLQIARPMALAQRVERGGGKMPLRAIL